MMRPERLIRLLLTQQAMFARAMNRLRLAGETVWEQWEKEDSQAQMGSPSSVDQDIHLVQGPLLSAYPYSIPLLELLFALESFPKLTQEQKELKVSSEWSAGQLQGSPPLQSLFKGLEEVEKQLSGDCSLKVLEAGYDQSEWDLKFKKLVASSDADLYITSNPSMTAIVQEVAQAYPSKHFIVFESKALSLANVITVDFCSEELAFLAGQEYPKMDSIIQAFRQGYAQYTNDMARVVYQVLGNWYDAERARQLSAQQYESGVKAILTIAGLANQGVFQSAQEKGFIDYKTPACHLVKQACQASLSFGKHYQYGVKDGLLGFLSSTPNLKGKLRLIEKEEEKLTN
ncbi:UNVERIFIED_CONTAM: hypothetical protein PYX00_010915 [Menopon gallinae]|uniref:ABC transporter substrate-binding protein PnrA-like domain-containing protein n=1 Tax=Menopon gallinae TaxID=328185 RepID=A0AAW2H6R6_9NEOP